LGWPPSRSTAGFGLAFLGSLLIAYTTGRMEAILYGIFPLAAAVVLFTMARKEPKE
jgi:hypothetical protein